MLEMDPEKRINFKEALDSKMFDSDINSLKSFEIPSMRKLFPG